jgi:peptidoglycan/LPS O-acetylase OafA/YrhL
VSRSFALPVERDAIGAGQPTTIRPSLPVLTTLRFFAAAEVVAFHVAQTKPGWSRPEGILSGLVSGGYAAVIFFFVLSGFILAYVHTGSSAHTVCNVKATRFWRLRFARIAPAYYLALLLALPLAIQAVAQSQASTWSITVGLASVLLFVQAWWPAYVTLWNFPAWSLSVECVFYALFPALARTLGRWPILAVMAGSYGLIALTCTYRFEFMGLAAMREQAADHWLVPTFFPLLHLPLFVFGMALARLYLYGRPLSPRLHAAMLATGIGLLVLVFGSAWLLPSWMLSDVVLVPIFALVIFGAAGATSSVKLLASPVLVLLGEASYSMYILHIPLRYCWENLTASMPALSLMPWLNYSLYFGFVVLVSVVVFRHFETPLRKLIAGRDAGSARPARIAPALQASGASSVRV